jgi:SAM-dependent methyltransferase
MTGRFFVVISSIFFGVACSSVRPVSRPFENSSENETFAEWRVPEKKTVEMTDTVHINENRYWDILASGDGMQDTSLLALYTERYFDNAVLPVYDSIIHAVDLVISKAGNNASTVKFLTDCLFKKYIRHIDGSGVSYITGMENVVVHIIDNYYLSGKVNVKDEQFAKEIAEYANKNRETLIGKKAKNLKMETLDGDAESLYDIDSPHILVCFFDAVCAHCQHEIPAIYKIFRKYKNRGLSGFCVYAYNDKKEWMEFVSKNRLTDWINVWDPKNENDFRIAYSVYSVPQIYLLDKSKTIIGRGLESESLARLLNRLINK